MIVESTGRDWVRHIDVKGDVIYENHNLSRWRRLKAFSAVTQVVSEAVPEAGG